MSEDPTKRLPRDDKTQIDSATEQRLRELVLPLENDLQTVKVMITDLSMKVDTRLQNTRPIWESVQKHLTELRGGMESIQRDVGSLKTDVSALKIDVMTEVRTVQESLRTLKEDVSRLRDDMDRGFRHLGRQLDVIAGNFVRLDASQRDFESRAESRLTDLETKVS